MFLYSGKEPCHAERTLSRIQRHSRTWVSFVWRLAYVGSKTLSISRDHLAATSHARRAATRCLALAKVCLCVHLRVPSIWFGIKPSEGNRDLRTSRAIVQTAVMFNGVQHSFNELSKAIQWIWNYSFNLCLPVCERQGSEDFRCERILGFVDWVCKFCLRDELWDNTKRDVTFAIFVGIDIWHLNWFATIHSATMVHFQRPMESQLPISGCIGELSSAIAPAPWCVRICYRSAFEKTLFGDSETARRVDFPKLWRLVVCWIALFRCIILYYLSFACMVSVCTHGRSSKTSSMRKSRIVVICH